MKKFILCLSVIGVLLGTMHSNLLAQQPQAKVYWMITIEIPLAKLGEYHQLAAAELAPMQEKYGYKFIGSWQTIVGNIEQVISIAEFENMEAYNKARQGFLGSEEWKAFSKKTDGMIKGVKTRFLWATPYSRIK